MDTIPEKIIPFLWLILIGYWIISAFSSKKTIRTSQWRKGMLFRVLITLFIIFFINSSKPKNFAVNFTSTAHSPVLQYLGLLLTVLGIGLAIWARYFLGKNWGMPATVKEQPELVTAGPYAYVRHPIYSGVLLGFFGTALAMGFLWLIFLAIFSVYFIYSASLEEKNMVRLFPGQYLEYKQRTKMLIPFIF